MRLVRVIAAVAVSCACTAGAAQASVSLKLSVSLKPEHLGQGTTVGFGFNLASRSQLAPPPLTRVDLRYPGTLGIGLSGLGLATCSVLTLEILGPEGCPSESRMGYGTVLAEIPIAGEVTREDATLAVLRSPTQNGHISLLFYAEGASPVSAHIVFPGILLPATPPYGGLIHIDVPLVPSVPGAPDVAVAQIHATLGPLHLTYYKHIGRTFIAYNPQGITLPHHCPRVGFPFAVELGFLDGSHTSTKTTVPCPRHG